MSSSRLHRPVVSRGMASRRVLAVTLASLMTASLIAGAPVAQAAPGDLDVSFGTGGKVITSLALFSDGADDVAVQPDGKLIVAGVASMTIGSVFVLARYNHNGSLDPTFGTGGSVTTGFGDGTNSQALGVVLQPDGKVVAAGRAVLGEPQTSHFGLVRYNANGTIDPGFGTDGKVFTPFPGADSFADSVVVQPDGKLVAAGRSLVAGGTADFALARYLPNGTLDPSFGTRGLVTTDFAGLADVAVWMVLQPDGKLVVAGVEGSGTGDGDFALARYLPNGTLDSSFGTGGKVTTDFAQGNDEASGLVLQPDGKLVAAGTANASGFDEDFALTRYNVNGTLDPGFGTGGRVTTDFTGNNDFGTTVVLQPDGKLVAAGFTWTPRSSDVALARYSTRGALDQTFGAGGKVTTDFAGGADDLYGLALQPDGRLVAAGSAVPGAMSGNWDFAVARYETGLAPNLALSQSVSPATVRVGGNVTWTFTVSNLGSLNVPGATLVVPLPANMTFVSSSGSPCSAPRVGSSGTVVCSIRPLGSLGNITVSIVTTARIPGVATTTATVASTGPVPDAQPADNTASRSVSVTP